MIQDLLKAMDLSGIEWVSWKNNHELAEALSGVSDLDIFVPLRHRRLFLDISRHEGWLQLENPSARVPWTTHLYMPKADGGFHHIHVYFRIVTGESWLKEYVLPMDEFVIKRRVRAGDYPVWVLDNKAQAYLFSIRHLLKGCSVMSRVLYRREIASYSAEWRRTGMSVSQLCGFGPWPLDQWLDSSGLADSTVVRLPAPWTSWKFRSTQCRYLRVAAWTLPFRRFSVIVRRLIDRRRRREKVFPGRGVIVAISGVDGAGKTSMLCVIQSAFAGIVRARLLRLGRPQGKMLDGIRKMLWAVRPVRSKGRDCQGSERVIPLSRAISAVVLATLRVWEGRRARRFADNGWLVLADRWPTATFGKMDGPKIPELTGSAFTSQLRRLEKWLYSRIPPADLCIVLTLPLETALARNRNRDKVEKESDAEIVSRFTKNAEISPIAKSIVYFDNSGMLQESLAQLTTVITGHLAMAVTQDRVVECVGMPGVGKTYIADTLAREEQLLGRLRIGTRSIDINRSALPTRLVRKVILSARVLLFRPRIVECIRTSMGRFHFTKRSERTRLMLNWLYLAGLIDLESRRCDTVILDQGLFQALWSTAFRGELIATVDNVAKDMCALLAELDIGELHVVEVTADTATIQRRLRMRPDGKSPLDSAPQAGWTRAVEAAKLVHEVLQRVNEHQAGVRVTERVNEASTDAS